MLPDVFESQETFNADYLPQIENNTPTDFFENQELSNNSNFEECEVIEFKKNQETKKPNVSEKLLKAQKLIYKKNKRIQRLVSKLKTYKIYKKAHKKKTLKRSFDGIDDEILACQLANKKRKPNGKRYTLKFRNYAIGKYLISPNELHHSPTD